MEHRLEKGEKRKNHPQNSSTSRILTLLQAGHFHVLTTTALHRVRYLKQTQRSAVPRLKQQNPYLAGKGSFSFYASSSRKTGTSVNIQLELEGMNLASSFILGLGKTGGFGGEEKRSQKVFCGLSSSHSKSEE